MISFKEENFKMYEKADKLPAKFTTAGNGRLNKDENYAVLGFCSVPETARAGKDPIKAWEGVALMNLRTGKRFPVGISTLVGIGFQYDGTNYKVQTVSKQAFLDVLAIGAHIGKTFHVDATEDLQVTPYLQVNKTEAKTYYLLSLTDDKYEFKAPPSDPTETKEEIKARKEAEKLAKKAN